jgi:hypothetical protein
MQVEGFLTNKKWDKVKSLLIGSRENSHCSNQLDMSINMMSHKFEISSNIKARKIISFSTSLKTSKAINKMLKIRQLTISKKAFSQNILTITRG